MIVQLILTLFLMMPMVMQAIIVGSNTAVSRQANLTFLTDDNDNEIRGFAAMESGFSLQNSACSCLFNAFYPISSTVVLNNGTFTLGQDVVFAEGINFTNVGTINGNGHTMRITTTADITLPSGIGKAGSISSDVFNFITSVDLGINVNSVDWSHDSQYIATGDAGNEFEVYEFDGTTLTQRGVSSGSDQINCVRWYPFDYYLAVCDKDNKVRTWYFDPAGPTFTEKHVETLGGIAHAVAWHPSGDYLAAASREAGAEIQVFSFSATGTLTLLTSVAISSGPDPQNNALSWDLTGDYLVIGLQNTANTELQVYSFDGSTLSLNASAELNVKVLAAEFSPTKPWIGVGLDNGSERLRIYEHDSGAGTLTDLTAAYVGEGTKVHGIHWSPDGEYLLMGREDTGGTEFRIYEVNQTTAALTVHSEIEHSMKIFAVRWSPNGFYVAHAGEDNKLYVYDAPHEIGVSTWTGGEFTFNNVNMLLDANVLLDKPARFQGACALSCNGHTLDLGSNGNIVVESGASLLLKDCMFKGLSGTNVRCVASSSKIVFENVICMLDADYTFTQGYLEFSGDVRITGTHTFVYQADQVSTIKKNARLYFDSGMTFSYDPITSGNNRLIFEDATATMHLYETTFQVTTTGLQLTKGTLIVEGTCPVLSDATQLSQGIVFGDGIFANNDLTVKILPESGFSLTSGYLICKNVGS